MTKVFPSVQRWYPVVAVLASRGGSEMRYLSLVALVGFVASCTFSRTDFQECSSNQDCQSVFGLGSSCNSDGLCEASERNVRCDQQYPSDLFTDSLKHADTIVFGSLMDRSAETKVARERAAQLAIVGANEAGGLEGRSFGMVFCNIEAQDDSEVRSENAVEAANYLVDTLGVPAIFGPSASGDTQTVFLDLESSGTLMISPSATSPALTSLDGDSPSDDTPGLLWRTAPPDDLQGKAIAADLLKDSGLRSSGTASVNKIAIIFEQGPYGEGLATVLSDEYEALCAGGTCLVDLRPYSNDSTRNAAIAEVGGDAATEEVVFISSSVSEVVAFLDAAAAINGFVMDGKRIFLTDSAANADVINGVGTDASNNLFDQIRGTRPKPLTQGEFAFGLFRAAYSAEYGEFPDQFSFTANSYDAGWLLVFGATWALLQEGSLDGLSMAKGLRKLSSGEDIDVQPTNYTAIRTKFQAGTSVNIEGASGELNFDPATEETSGPVETWQISGANVVNTCGSPAMDTVCVYNP